MVKWPNMCVNKEKWWEERQIVAEAMFEVTLAKNYSKLSKDSFKLDIQEPYKLQTG